jgi:hypothetical protein
MTGGTPRGARRFPRRRFGSGLGAGLTALTAAVALGVNPVPLRAAAAVCGASGNHTICVTMPVDPDATGTYVLSGDERIGVTNAPNAGALYFTWVPSGGTATYLMEDFAPSAQDGGADYAFTWPTEKFLDGAGLLQVRYGTNASVNVAVALANGNASSIQTNPSDWPTAPAPWTDPNADPVVVAVGDGASDEAESKTVSDQIAAASPPLFLYLGDIYEKGTFTETLNHYGVSSLDEPGSGTLFGQLASVTQPTLGNHEKKNLSSWRDYFHGRPAYTSFTFGGVLFIDVNANMPMKAGSPEYTWVQGLLSAPDVPACIVAYWHQPVLNGTKILSGKLPMWSLLANNGGDLVLNGHIHSMAAYGPLNATMQQGSGAHMYELVDGAGGHKMGSAPSGDARQVFRLGKTPGSMWLTLNGAHADAEGNPGVATSISWTYRYTNGSPIPGGSGTVSC